MVYIDLILQEREEDFSALSEYYQQQLYKVLHTDAPSTLIRSAPGTDKILIE